MHLRYNWMSYAWPASPLKLYLAQWCHDDPPLWTARESWYVRPEVAGPGRKGAPHRAQNNNVRPNSLGVSENPENVVIKQKYQRFDFIKPYSYLTREEYHIVLSTAKKLDLYVAGHIPFQVGLDGILAEGMHEIAHVEELLWEFINLDRDQYFPKQNPLENVANTRKISGVMAAGRWYDQKALAALIMP